jgi:4'-phosphopantetheinyl transferase EntD
VVKLSLEFTSIGADAEPALTISDNVLKEISVDQECRYTRNCVPRDDSWLLQFVAKESILKAWFPILKLWLGFQGVRIIWGPEQTSFSPAPLTENASPLAAMCSRFVGRYLITEQFMFARHAHLPCQVSDLPVRLNLLSAQRSSAPQYACYSTEPIPLPKYDFLFAIWGF